MSSVSREHIHVDHVYLENIDSCVLYVIVMLLMLHPLILHD